MRLGVLKQFSKRQLLIGGGLAIGVVVCGIAVIIMNQQVDSANQEDKPVAYSTDRPDENPIPDNYKWRGGPEYPKFIELPTIKASGFIQKMSVDQHKQIAVPTNINLAGWFVESVRPGQTGLSIIDGHVNGRKADGIFKNLKNLKNGDEFTVKLGSGKTLRYKVFGQTSVATKDAPNVLFSQDPTKKSQLNLITCGGAFNKKANQYEQRVIVNAELL